VITVPEGPGSRASRGSRPSRGPERLRLFVALEAPEPVVADLAAAVDDVRAEHPQLRWLPSDRWHLTLAFLGSVDAHRVDDLRGRLARAAARHHPVPLELAGAGRFGGRVLWVGLRGAVADVGRLADSVAAGCRRAGVPVEDRPYRPHLTVARGRDRGTDLRPAVAALADYAGPRWTATEVHLVRSHLGPVVRYERLDGFPLGRPPTVTELPSAAGASPARPPDAPPA
jgi:RNA 2',3'-cyclic 3'-phosphodiesterase